MEREGVAARLEKEGEEMAKIRPSSCTSWRASWDEEGVETAAERQDKLTTL